MLLFFHEIYPLKQRKTKQWITLQWQTIHLFQTLEKFKKQTPGVPFISSSNRIIQNIGYFGKKSPKRNYEK